MAVGGSRLVVHQAAFCRLTKSIFGRAWAGMTNLVRMKIPPAYGRRKSIFGQANQIGKMAAQHLLSRAGSMVAAAHE